MIELALGAVLVALAPVCGHRSGQWRERANAVTLDRWARPAKDTAEAGERLTLEDNYRRASMTWGIAGMLLLAGGLVILLSTAWPCQ